MVEKLGVVFSFTNVESCFLQRKDRVWGRQEERREGGREGGRKAGLKILASIVDDTVPNIKIGGRGPVTGISVLKILVLGRDRNSTKKFRGIVVLSWNFS